MVRSTRWDRILTAILACVLLINSQKAFSQQGKLPPFQIIQSNGRLFKAQELPIGKPIIIVYFSPECEECQRFTEAIISRIDDFLKASIAMITYFPVQDVAKYVSEYKLNIYPNIYVGTEGNSFFLRYYYNIQRFPFIALYNEKGNLIKIWDKEENIDDLANRLRVL